MLQDLRKGENGGKLMIEELERGERGRGGRSWDFIIELFNYYKKG